METNKSQQNDILTTHSELLQKQRCGKSILVSAIYLIISVIAIVIAESVIANSTSALHLFLMTLGISGICAAIAKFIFLDKKYVFLPTKSVVKKYSIYFKPEELTTLERAVEKREISLMADIAAGNTSAGLRLDVMISKDGKFGACQIFKFIPYHFEAASSVHTIEDQSLPLFISTVKELNSRQ